MHNLRGIFPAPYPQTGWSETDLVGESRFPISGGSCATLPSDLQYYFPPLIDGWGKMDAVFGPWIYPMELSIFKLQEPASVRPMGERRRRIRHKLYSPVYARFNGSNAGMVLELSELLDVSEDGFSVQTSDSLKLNQVLSFSLDLPETKAFIHATGQVVWSDQAGRSGIRFEGLPEPSRRDLKEWLFVNLMLASSKSTARPEQVDMPAEKNVRGLRPVPPSSVSSPITDLSGMLAAVEAVRHEVHSAADFEAALHLVTERALSLTEASGAALAFITDDKMICRASAGEPALPLGTVVDAKRGLTGECVRSGRMVTCDDVETDGRVDREICRMLGIGSMLATPIVSDFRVVGLLEVFSPLPHAFTKIHETGLDRLVELLPKVQAAAPPVRDATPEIVESPVTEPARDRAISGRHAVSEAVWEPERVAQEPLKGVPVRLGHILLLALTAAAVFLVAGYLSAPKIEELWFGKSAAVGRPTPSSIGTVEASGAVARPKTFDDLRQLADQGDAEAQYEVGARYRNGEGVVQDDARAAEWFQRAADQGHLYAQGALGAAYWAGRGVPKDLNKSYFWSSIAANQGDETSGSRLQGLALSMTQSQLAAAQSQANDWLKQRRAAK
jgi:putative methionine-R-sulfoxide reductase with GAF domain